ncbi:MAG: DNA translocase FtsK 4TM domain-containing protein, partial [Mariniphaga sp.]|nr:DNA translocase FtsK 4TM domain-containing protein [Mariniphaga sp.]
MAVNKRRSGKNKVQRKKKTGTRFYKDDRFKYSFGVLFLLIATYLVVAFVSFLFYGSADQSKLDLSWSELVFNSDIRVGNKAGKTGAFLSEFVINRGFGIASYIFIYMVAVAGINILGRRAVRFGKTLLLGSILVLWLSIVFGFIFLTNESGQYTFLGGRYGLVMSVWLKSIIGSAGTVLFLLMTGFIIIVTYFKNSITWIKKIFRRKEKNVEKEVFELNVEQEEIIPEETISKVIEDDDVVKAIFEPDEEEETLEVIAGEETIEKALITEEDNLELTIEERLKEEEQEFDKDKMEDYDPTLELSGYKLPSLDLLVDHDTGNAEVSNEELISNKNKIVETLRHYKIEITKIRATIGPTITLYEIIPAPGIRIAKIKNLEDDIALSLAALGIRIIAPIPGRGTIGIEVPNQNPEIVSMRSIISSKKFQESTADLPIVIGKTISNEAYMFDLAKMPHILVAGATGQGKSVGLNVIISSLLYKKHPSELKFIFFDPKKVELSLYTSIEKH